MPVDTQGGFSFPGQWHLYNKYYKGIDVNIIPAWKRDLTGQGVTIGVVDEGMEHTHPDLAPNYSAADSFDFTKNDSDPMPEDPFEAHATCVGGVAAARGGNGIGGTGAAPFASLSSLRIANFTDAEIVPAIKYHSSDSTATIQIKNHSYGFSPYSATTDQEAALNVSIGNGTIHVMSAGNSRGGWGEDANLRLNQSNPGVITVAALSNFGVYSDYSNFGANVFVTAPSSSFIAGGYGIVTSDRQGDSGYNWAGYSVGQFLYDTDLLPDTDYTSNFGGTSSASPLVAGVLALAKQAQPKLDVWFAKQLLAITSKPVHLDDKSEESDGGWKTNAAGYKFNQSYGFGLINTDLLTKEAVIYTGITPTQSETTSAFTVNKAIPDNNVNGVTSTFTLNSTDPLETLRIVANINHTYRGDLEIYLTSPSGTVSRLLMRDAAEGGTNVTNWRYSTNAFWGENPKGTWTLKVCDRFAQDTGTWVNYAVRIWTGRLIAVPSVTTISPRSVVVGTGDTTLTVTGNGYTPVSYITWNGTPLKTTFVAYNQLTATLPASQLAANATATVQVVTPDPGGASATSSFYVGTALTPALIGTKRVGSEIQVFLRVKNYSTINASAVTLTSASLVQDSPALLVKAKSTPITYGAINGGKYLDKTIHFDGSAVTKGATLHLKGTFTQSGNADVPFDITITAP